MQAIPDEIWTLAYGVFRGNRLRTQAVLQIAFCGTTVREAEPIAGVSAAQLSRDRRLFQRVLGQYRDQRASRN